MALFCLRFMWQGVRLVTLKRVLRYLFRLHHIFSSSLPYFYYLWWFWYCLDKLSILNSFSQHRFTSKSPVLLPLIYRTFSHCKICYMFVSIAQLSVVTSGTFHSALKSTHFGTLPDSDILSAATTPPPEPLLKRTISPQFDILTTLQRRLSQQLTHPPCLTYL